MHYLFDEFRLDVDRRELRRGPMVVDVAPQVFDILECLLRHHDRVVSKDDLIAEVWDGRIVSESTISSRLTAVRSAIDDSGRDQRLVRTIPRRGYRVVCPVTKAPGPDEPTLLQARERPTEPPAGNLISRLERMPRIAVLSFTGTPGDPSHTGFVNGLVEDITTALSHIPWLAVSARSASFAYSGWAVDIRQVRTGLGANYVLEGSVRDANNRIRVTARLIDTETGSSLWASRFDVWREDVFDLQDLISARVVNEIGARLELREIERAEQSSDSVDPVDHYMRGLGGLYTWTRDGVDRALGQFQQAIRLDPEFAAPYGMAAYCYVQRKSYGWTSNRSKEAVECGDLVQRASELRRADGLTLAKAAHAISVVVDDTDSGEQLVEDALRRHPNLANAWYVSGWIKLFQGDHRLAADHLTRAIKLSPSDTLLFKMEAALSYAHFFLSDYEQASVYAAKALRARPNYLTAMRGAAACQALSGRLGEARRLMSQVRKHDPALCLSNLAELIPFHRSQDVMKWTDALGLAGLPDEAR